VNTFKAVYAFLQTSVLDLGFPSRQGSRDVHQTQIWVALKNVREPLGQVVADQRRSQNEAEEAMASSEKTS